MAINTRVSENYQGALQTVTSTPSTGIGLDIVPVNTISDIKTDRGFYQLPDGTLYSVNSSGIVSLINNISPYIKNLNKGSNYTKLITALRNTQANIANTRILFCGDSTTNGVIAGSGVTLRAKSYIVPTSNITGLRTIPAGWQNFIGIDVTNGHTADATLDPRTNNLTAAWGGFDAANHIGYDVFYNTSTAGTAPAGTAITFTPTVPTDSFYVVYWSGGGGYDNFLLKSGVTTIATANPGTGTNQFEIVTGSTTLGLNSYSIEKVVGGSAAIIQEFGAYNSASKEINLLNAGANGSALTTWFAKAPTQPWQTLNVIKSSSYKCHCCVIDFGINDLINNFVPLATFKTQLDYSVNFLLTNNIPVIMRTFNPIPISISSLANQTEYANSILSVASKYNVICLDLFNKWGTAEAINASNGYMLTNDVHPTELGYADKAMMFNQVIEYLLS